MVGRPTSVARSAKARAQETKIDSMITRSSSTGKGKIDITDDSISSGSEAGQSDPSPPDWAREICSKLDSLTSEVRVISEEFSCLKDAIKEIHTLREVLEAKTRLWEEEKCDLLGRLRTLEWKTEVADRRSRKNNITIRGLELTNSNIEDTVQQFLVHKIEVQAKFDTAFSVGKQQNRKLLVVKMRSFEEKQKVLQNKHKLRGTKIYIGDDWTQKECEVQRQIRLAVADDIKAGRKVIVGYRKATINGKLLKWKDDQGLIESSLPQREDLFHTSERSFRRNNDQEHSIAE